MKLSEMSTRRLIELAFELKDRIRKLDDLQDDFTLYTRGFSDSVYEDYMSTKEALYKVLRAIVDDEEDILP